MCGILGLYSPSRQLPDEAAFAAACTTLRHRGPDDQGIFRDDGVLLGHRRLAIIDLNSGHQPIHNEDRTIWTVYNGEIYNYLELRDELEGLGHAFYTASDTEIIVHAYEQWGVDGFARLRGMFAIALWDAGKRRLVLARDPLGKKPLFVTTRGDRTAFASELKALRALPDFDFTVDPEACRDFALMGYVPTPASIYKEVRKLRAGHALVVEADGELREQRFWRLSMTPKHQADEAELLDQLDQHLNDAVRLRLRSDVPFGAFLSGGLDSSIVTALMAKHMDRPVRTYSIGFEEAAFNELGDARLIAGHIGSEHHEHIVSADAVGLLDKLVFHLDEPFADSSAIPTYLVAEAAARDVKMVLSGDGGDEIFGGYQRYLKQQTIERLRRLSLGLAGPALQGLGGLLPTAFGRRLGWLGRRTALPFPARYISGVALCTPAEAGAWLAGADPARWDYGRAERGFDHDYEEVADRMIHGDIETYLLDDILVKVDRMTMANSLEARAPLLDAPLAAWATRLPYRMKIRDGRGKYLLRRLAERYLPAEALDKKKQGFAIPLAHWFRHDLAELAADTIGSADFRDAGVFDQSIAAGMLAQHRAGERDHGEHLWQMLVFTLWHRMSRDRPVPVSLAAGAG
ncbi:MAG: asparagine synthase (glutamine-hydrolyzing) [Alphaproteobacteria bacterium]